MTRNTKDTPPATRYTHREELLNMGTHAVGVAFSIAALVILVTYAARHGGPYRIVSVSIFGASLILLYLASTLYHAIRHPEVKHVFRLIDHACIYLLIAGSYTPFLLVTLRGGWGWSLFGVIWGLALCGILFKVFFSGRFNPLSVIMYVAMGWVVIVAIKPLIHAVPAGGIAWLVAGGALYTSGILFYAWKRMPYHHAVWHLFVMAGSFCHFFAVYLYVLPPSTT